MKKQKTTLISWKAPEFKHYPKNPAWYLTLGVLTGVLTLFLFLQDDIFGAVCILLIAIFIVIFANRKPKEIEISLTSTGIKIGESFIPYNSIKHFWLVYNDRHQTLNLSTSSYLNHTIIIELSKQDPMTVQEILLSRSAYHPDPEIEETVSQKIIHKLKF